MKTYDGRKGKRLPIEIVSHMRFFAFYTGNETLLANVEPWGIDYDITIIYEKSNALGDIFAIDLYSRYNEKGNVIPVNKATQRIGEYIQSLNENNEKELAKINSWIERDSGKNWRDVVVRFTRDLGLRNLNTEPLRNFDSEYASGGMIDDGSAFEQLIAILGNTLRMDDNYNVINEDWIRYRASQYIRRYNERSYKIDPPLKEWETILWL